MSRHDGELKVLKLCNRQHVETVLHKLFMNLPNFQSWSECLKLPSTSQNPSFVLRGGNRMEDRSPPGRKLLGILGFLCLWITAEAQMKIPPET